MRGKPSLLIHGIINVCIHIPALLATSFWGLFIIGIFNLDSITNPFWYFVTMFPILLPLISCIIGIIRGIIFIKHNRFAKVCLLLSILGIFLYVGMIFLCGWLGSVA